MTDTLQYCTNLADDALAASRELMTLDGRSRAKVLYTIAGKLEQNAASLKTENAKDLAAGQANGLAPAMLDRLKLDDKGIKAMADSVRQVADQIDPVGQIIEGYVRPNGIALSKVRVPIGVVLIIFESRPNVTSDAAALCIKSGNAVILRGGKEAIHSNKAIADIVRQGLVEGGVNPKAVQLVETTDREAVGHLLKMEGKIDVAIPRGGESLIRAVVEQARIPVIKHYTGNCHTYLHTHADHDMAVSITVNGKTQRTGVCNATETLLIDKAAADAGLLVKVCQALVAKGVEIRGDAATQKLFPAAKAATEKDWDTEYLDLIIAVKVVADLSEAVAHINKHGSRHTDAIVTNDIAASQAFIQRVDSANVFVNCSTRFSDGGEYGLGAEIGISTDKLHARGPMGAQDLTTYKWVAQGNGQIRG